MFDMLIQRNPGIALHLRDAKEYVVHKGRRQLLAANWKTADHGVVVYSAGALDVHMRETYHNAYHTIKRASRKQIMYSHLRKEDKMHAAEIARGHWPSPSNLYRCTNNIGKMERKEEGWAGARISAFRPNITEMSYRHQGIKWGEQTGDYTGDSPGLPPPEMPRRRYAFRCHRADRDELQEGERAQLVFESPRRRFKEGGRWGY